MFLFFLFGILFQGCYITKQAYHQGKRLLNRKDVSVVLEDPQTPEKLKKKLLELQDVMAFAKEEGLNTENAYHKIIMMEDDHSPVSYLVHAAYPLELKAYTWWFPIVGHVPYLGFFSETERDAKFEELRKEGLDVIKGGASAFSSLGWFEDPLYSSMLKRSQSHLADLIFHELTHRTFWAEGQALWNEQLASFVAKKLTLSYLVQKNLLQEKEAYLAWHEDREVYRVWLEALTEDLKKLYENKEHLPEDQMIKNKEDLFHLYLTEKRPKFQKVDFVGQEVWNNATVLGESLYSPEFERFEKSYQCAKVNKAGDFLEKIRANLTKDVDQVLDSFCR